MAGRQGFEPDSVVPGPTQRRLISSRRSLRLPHPLKPTSPTMGHSPMRARRSRVAAPTLLLIWDRVRWCLSVGAAAQRGPIASLKGVAVPQPADLARYVADPQTLVVLGKALFWDVQVGSDGRTACATCHFHAGADHRVTNQIAGPAASRRRPVRPNTHTDNRRLPVSRLRQSERQPVRPHPGSARGRRIRRRREANVRRRDRRRARWIVGADSGGPGRSRSVD